MPTTFTGLMLFLVLLVPGFAYVSVRRRSRPAQRVSVFQETASVAIASALAISIALGVFALIRINRPADTPDIGLLIREGRDYFEQEYALVGGWALGVMAAATVVAAAAGWAVAKLPVHPSSMSAWGMSFEKYADGRDPTVTCILDDGSWVRGGTLVLQQLSR
jgi:amino acid transporter